MKAAGPGKRGFSGSCRTPTESTPMNTEHIQAPNVIARFANRPPNNGDPTNQRHELLEEAILALLRQHCPAYLKTDGRSIRTAFSRAFVRFVLERAHGNQARAAEIGGFNRNTIRRLVRTFGIRCTPRAAH